MIQNNCSALSYFRSLLRRAVSGDSRRNEAGFTVIEALVAFAILSLALVGLYDALAVAYHSANASRMQEEALAVGRSQLERIGSDIPAKPGKLSGSLSDSSPWQVVITEIASNGSTPSLYQRYAVAYEARDAQNRPILQLKTIRIAKAAR